MNASMLHDFEKVKTVFKSCENYQQFEVAKRLLFNFFEKYKTEFDTWTKIKTVQQIQPIMDDCTLRFIK